ncbi:MAG: L-threonine 3-dehydrogenase [Phycisphaera sp.]|nr:L-threonine 3-dehydrogenase [Phycisphaera sp.]
MRAIEKSRPERGLWMTDVPMPKVGDHDVLIQVHKTGICGTDLHIYQWDDWAKATIPVPMVVGHEFVGQIVEVGSRVVDFKVGMRVSGEGHVVCGRCRNCMAGRRHLCKSSKGIGVNRPGAFAEYVSIPSANVWEHARQVPDEVASIFDPLGNAVHTALQFDLLGEDVLITGAGPIGCMAAAVARHAGARHIVVTDVNPYRLQLAKTLGATRSVDVRNEKLPDVQHELGMHEGFDVGLEMSGNAKAFADMVDNMCHGGKISLLGIPHSEIKIDWNKVIFNMLTIRGVYGREMYETWYKMTVFVQAGMDVGPVITHRLKADEFENGIEAMIAGECGKVVLDWRE